MIVPRNIWKLRLIASGYATEKFEAYKNSLSGSIEDFKNSFQSLSNTLIGSDFLKGIVDAGAGALDILDSLIDKFDVLIFLSNRYSNISRVKRRWLEFTENRLCIYKDNLSHRGV